MWNLCDLKHIFFFSKPADNSPLHYNLNFFETHVSKALKSKKEFTLINKNSGAV